MLNIQLVAGNKKALWPALENSGISVKMPNFFDWKNVAKSNNF
jgi:hypothetical protein